MKIVAVIAALVVLCAGIAVWLYLGIRPHITTSGGAITVRESTGFVAELPAARAESIQRWFAEHQTGWRPSFVTYAPQTTFSADTFQINILRNAIVLNYSGSTMWQQIVRSLSSDERVFRESLLADAKRPNQAMQLTASKPDVHPWRVCRRESILRRMHRGLAAADLVSR